MRPVRGTSIPSISSFLAVIQLHISQVSSLDYPPTDFSILSPVFCKGVLYRHSSTHLSLVKSESERVIIGPEPSVLTTIMIPVSPIDC